MWLISGFDQEECSRLQRGRRAQRAIPVQWWGLESAAQRAGTGARLACLRFLPCHMGTVTAPWFLGLISKVPRTGWHRGCPQSCCAVAPAPGVRRAPAPGHALCCWPGRPTGFGDSTHALTEAWALWGSRGQGESGQGSQRELFSLGAGPAGRCLQPTPVGRVRRAGCGGQTDPCLWAPKADLEL